MKKKTQSIQILWISKISSCEISWIQQKSVFPTSLTDISKPGQIKLKLCAWLDITRIKEENRFNLMTWPFKAASSIHRLTVWPTLRASPFRIPVRLGVQPLLSLFLLHLLRLLCLLKAQLSLAHCTRQKTSNKCHRRLFFFSNSSCRLNNILDDNDGKEWACCLISESWAEGGMFLNERKCNQYCRESCVNRCSPKYELNK